MCEYNDNYRPRGSKKGFQRLLCQESHAFYVMLQTSEKDFLRLDFGSQVDINKFIKEGLCLILQKFLSLVKYCCLEMKLAVLL